MACHQGTAQEKAGKKKRQGRDGIEIPRKQIYFL